MAKRDKGYTAYKISFVSKRANSGLHLHWMCTQYTGSLVTMTMLSLLIMECFPVRNNIFTRFWVLSFITQVLCTPKIISCRGNVIVLIQAAFFSNSYCFLSAILFWDKTKLSALNSISATLSPELLMRQQFPSPSSGKMIIEST